jgi:hypothetical protein
MALGIFLICQDLVFERCWARVCQRSIGDMQNQNPLTRPRLDKLDLLSDTVIEDYNHLIWLECIKNAVQTYLNFGLKLSIKVTAFFDAYWYLFMVRSTDPSTWGSLKKKHTADQVADQCFDVHYERSGLAEHCTITRFLNKIRMDRQEIVTSNWEGILEFAHKERQRDLKHVEAGAQLSLPIVDMEQALVTPTDPAKLAELFYYPSKMMVPQLHKSYKDLSASKFSQFWEKAENLVKSVENTKRRSKHKPLQGQLSIELEESFDGYQTYSEGTSPNSETNPTQALPMEGAGGG